MSGRRAAPRAAARVCAAVTIMALAPALLAGGCASGSKESGQTPRAPATPAAVTRIGPWGTAAALESLRAGGVAVLGAVQVNEVDQARPPLIAALDSVLPTRWAGVPVRPYRWARHALDDSTARFLLLGYQIHGLAEPLWLGRAADSLVDSVRYGVLARVRRTRERTVDRETDRADASGKPIHVRATVVEGEISFHLYDLARRELAFSVNLVGSATKEAPADSLPKPERPPLRDWSTPEDRSLEAVTPPIEVFPEAPPVAVAVARVIATFADSTIGAVPR
jgi:hypothetical protein